jgi:hypothetical protein
MKRKTLRLAVDVTAFGLFVLLTATGVLMRYVLPPGSGRFSVLWGMNRHDWGALHFWIAVAFMGSLAVHLLLNWRWVTSAIKGRPREGSGVRVALAVVGLLAVVALAFSPFFARVESTGHAPHRQRTSESDHSGSRQISGSQTLRQVSEETGVPLEHLMRGLGLPDDVDVDEPLGRLRREYGFTMRDVREIVQKEE